MFRSGRGLARSLSAAAFGKIVAFTAYKAVRAGRIVHKVDRFFPSTKTCRPCGHVHRDQNAAENIRDETIRNLRAAGLVVLGA